MFKVVLNKFMLTIGYKIVKNSNNSTNEQLFALYQYRKEDGMFDYEKYRKVQIEGNKRKLNKVWVIEENIKFLSQYIKKSIPEPAFGICHGTRQGKEQEWFQKYLGCEVIGTEISDTAKAFSNTIQWDFHKVKPNWVEAADFIYSNSFDHTYNPEKCINAWMSSIRDKGICIIEYSSEHGPFSTSQLDPFGADIFIMPYLILKWGKGKYCVKEILKAPRQYRSLKFICYLIIGKV